MCRSLLAALKPSSMQDDFISSIIALARQQQLLIDGIAVIDEGQLAPREPVPPGGGSYKADADREAIAAGRKIAADLMNQLTEATRNQEVECQVIVEDGDVSNVLAAAVQRCDFMLCGAKRHADSTERSLLFSILKKSSRPVLVMPPDQPPGTDVLVAYDGSLQSSRALAAFVSSGLWKGRTIHLVAFEDGVKGRAEQVKSAATFLHRYGIDYELDVCQSSRNVGQDLLKEIQRLEAGMLVMGAFSKSVVRDFILGSVTRTVLREIPVPIFLDH